MLTETGYALRQATLDDLAQVITWPQTPTELHYLFPRSTWPADQMALISHLAKHENNYVVTDQEHLLGYASLYDVGRQRCAWIGHLIVAPRARGLGVGRFLVSALQTIAREQYGAKEIAVICFASNLTALDFYQKLEFEIEGWELRLDHRGESTKVYRLVHHI